VWIYSGEWKSPPLSDMAARKAMRLALFKWRIFKLLPHCELPTTEEREDLPQTQPPQKLETLGPASFKMLFNEEVLSDITILFEGGQKLPAHRILLYARSPLFRFAK